MRRRQCLEKRGGSGSAQKSGEAAEVLRRAGRKQQRSGQQGGDRGGGGRALESGEEEAALWRAGRGERGEDGNALESEEG